jgi:hypothetical protein
MLVIMPLTATDLPEPVVPATSRCGILARFTLTGAPLVSLPRQIWSLPPDFLKPSSSRISFRYTVSRFLFGISMPTTALPGMGATMRTDCASSAMARSFSSCTILPVRVPGAGANSKVMMTGPIWMAVTLPCTP